MSYAMSLTGQPHAFLATCAARPLSIRSQRSWIKKLGSMRAAGQLCGEPSEERTIRDRIGTINGSLRDIDYHDGTYIAVEAAANLDIEIRVPAGSEEVH